MATKIAAIMAVFENAGTYCVPFFFEAFPSINFGGAVTQRFTLP